MIFRILDNSEDVKVFLSKELPDIKTFKKFYSQLAKSGSSSLSFHVLVQNITDKWS